VLTDLKMKRTYTYASSLRMSQEAREEVKRYADLCGISANKFMELSIEAILQMCRSPMADKVPVPKLVWQTQMWLEYMKTHPKMSEPANGNPH